MNPLAHIDTFLNGLDQDIQVLLSELVIARIPGPDWKIDGTLLDLREQFKQSGNSIIDTGNALHLRALLDFELLRQGDPARWDDVVDFQQRVLTSPRATENMREMVRKNLATLPDRKQRCMGAAALWRQLRDNELSDAAIDAWDRTELRKSNAVPS
jgi:hypothetical protein